MNRLHEAIEKNDEVYILNFLKEGGNPNIPNENGYTLLHLACMNKNISNSVMRLLIDSTQNLSVPTKGDGTLSPIHLAIIHKNHVALESLIKAGANINVKAAFDLTPLHLASYYDNSEGASILIRAGANINAKSSSLSTPLQEAIKICNFRMVEFLIGYGARLNEQDQYGRSELHCAFTSWRKKPEGEIDASVISLLILGGADPNLADKNGRTPLHYAVKLGFPLGVQLLVDNGANPNIRLKLLTPTPMELAQKYQDAKILAILEQKNKKRDSWVQMFMQ